MRCVKSNNHAYGVLWYFIRFWCLYVVLKSPKKNRTTSSALRKMMKRGVYLYLLMFTLLPSFSVKKCLHLSSSVLVLLLWSLSCDCWACCWSPEYSPNSSKMNIIINSNSLIISCAALEWCHTDTASLLRRFHRPLYNKRPTLASRICGKLIDDPQSRSAQWGFILCLGCLGNSV